MFIRNVSRFVIFIIAICAPIHLCADEQKPARSTSVYKLDYVFSEMQNGKRVNARSYSILVRLRDRGSIRFGNRLPVVMGVKDGGNQSQYLDIGVNIDCRVEDTDIPDVNSAIDLFTNVDISSLAPDQAGENRTGNPIVRQIKFQNENIVPLGKLIVLSSADEVDGTRRLQIEVTATKLK